MREIWITIITRSIIMVTLMVFCGWIITESGIKIVDFFHKEDNENE